MNWEEIRANAAIAAMQTMVGLYNHNTAARIAVEYADALVKKLRSHSAPTDDEH